MYRVDQKSGAADSWPYFCQILTDLKKLLEDSLVNLQLNGYGLVHFARLANTLLKDKESARHNHVLACNFAKYLPIKNSFFHSQTE